MSPITITIENCNNIDSAVISITPEKLNIKFAPNGTGKSTIAKAIELSSSKENGNMLGKLIPFKLKKGNPQNKQPKVIGAEALKNVMCFNEEYVNKFVFKKDELLNNSFNIFIETDDYKAREKEINDLVSNVIQLFSGNQELETLIVTLREMGKAFTLTKAKSVLSKTSSGMSGLSTGNKIQHVPPGLESYTPFIQSQNSVNWIEWQTHGCEFTDLSDNCPFCTSPAADKRDQIEQVGKEYNKTVIENLVAIITIVKKLGDYFSVEANGKLNTITTLKDGLEKEHENYLITVKKQIDDFTNKLETLRNISTFQFTNGDKVAEKLPKYKLDLHFFSELNSNKLQEAIKPINASIDDLINQAGRLQGMISQQLVKMQESIERHQKVINEFLAFAGFRYNVEIVGVGKQAQLKLRHVDHDEHISGGVQHLSFGERNAFAIVLFMYECLATNPDLIILDDPISSFDKNKKYAILEMLFRRDAKACLKNKTVLMLTHDIEPIIDTIKALSHKFHNQTSASFLKLVAGHISELSIGKKDILTFSQICKNVLESDKDDIVKLIYMRRNLEIADSKADAYQVVSNLLKKRERALDTRDPNGTDDCHPEMKTPQFLAGCNEILLSLENFSYPNVLKRIKDYEALKVLYSSSTNGYEKLQVFRLLLTEDVGINPVIEKFIKETYHIENEFICQLDPNKFDTIPEYVIAECDKILNEKAKVAVK